MCVYIYIYYNNYYFLLLFMSREGASFLEEKLAPVTREMVCLRPFLGACTQRSWALPPVLAPQGLSSRGLGYSFASEDSPHLLCIPWKQERSSARRG